MRAPRRAIPAGLLRRDRYGGGYTANHSSGFKLPSFCNVVEFLTSFILLFYLDAVLLMNMKYFTEYILAKNVLCSSDIQVGDTFYEEGDTTERIANTWEEAKAASTNSGMFKIIGVISPNALSYVKVREEFNDDQLGFCSSDGSIIKESFATTKNFKGAMALLKNGHWKVAIIGPCGHLH